MNPYVWELYLKSGGDKVVKFFEESLTNPLSVDYAERIKMFQSIYAADIHIIENTYKQILNVIKDSSEDGIETYDEEITEANIAEVIDQYTETTWEGLIEIYDFNVVDAFYELIDSIAEVSTIAAQDRPEAFIPYYFQCNYNVLESIASAFDIKLPEIPKKKDYKGRFMFYGEICKVLYEFRKENRWSPYELCAFLYDFAPKYIGGKESYIISDLPEPKSAFFVGGSGKEEVGDITAEDRGDIERWQCSPETRAGDMIVMYIKSPVSAITSIWRSCSVGFNDPFFYYYRCTYIGLPIKVRHLSLDQIKSDPVLGEMPIVKKNMQGINGVELKPSEYNHILDACECQTIRMDYSVVSADGEYATEKEVENEVIKPFLNKLGYDESDYVQQLYIPIGNHNNLLIPDFVLLPETRGGYQSAFAIVEAKRSISNKKELEDALGQARSYALQLGVKYSVIASQEGIWITTAKDRYDEVVLKCTWDEPKDVDTFFAIKKMIGKD